MAKTKKSPKGGRNAETAGDKVTAGAAAGAATGALIGFMVPLFGPVAGSVIGAVLGGSAASIADPDD